MEEIYVYIGNSGAYQMLIFCALLPFGLYSGLDIASQNVLYGVPDHWCRVPYLSNYTPEEQREMAIPVDETTGKHESCVFYEVTNSSGINYSVSVAKCSSWFYDDGVFSSSAVTEVYKVSV